MLMSCENCWSRAAVEGEVVQQEATAFGQLFKVAWIVPEYETVTLRSLWEIRSEQTSPRLVSAFVK